MRLHIIESAVLTEESGNKTELSDSQYTESELKTHLQDLLLGISTAKAQIRAGQRMD